MSFIELLVGALRSKVFWEINLACLLVMLYPVAYITAIFLSAGTLLKPILIVGLYIQCGLGAAIVGFKEYKPKQ